MTKTVWIRMYDAIDLGKGDFFRGCVPADFASELKFDGNCIYDDEDVLLDEAGLGAYVQPHVNAKADWVPFYNTVRFDHRLAAFLIRYERFNKVRNWRRRLPRNFAV